ncbi:hypothetical protein PG991_000154 [Apiospora marii]|uniref:Mid2 domain-containing protein n=1 Tax=Apiospora marii TaxID=335849 RepID=A0ABR1T1B1_9PEZI
MTFVNPDQEIHGQAVDWGTNIIHPVGSKMTVQWTTNDVDRNGITLYIFQNGRPGAEAEHIFRNVSFFSQKNQWDWVVATSRTLDNGNVFALGLFYEGHKSPAAMARAFNITNPAGSSKPQPSSSISSQSSNSAGPASSTSQAGPTSTTTPPSVSPNVPSDSGLRDEQKIGLGVGIGVGIPFCALVGFCCFLLWRLSKRQTNKEQHQDQAAVVSDRGSGLYFAGNKQELDGGRYREIRELPAAPGEPRELP